MGSKKERVGEDDIGSTENIPIGAKEAPSLGLLGEESRLDLILKSERRVVQKNNESGEIKFPFGFEVIIAG